MKIAYLDCQSGISGDMLLGALIDAGVSPKWFKEELANLRIPNYVIKIKKVQRNGIAATKVDVISKEKHLHRNLQDIQKIINKSRFSPASKTKILKVFTELAKVEAKIHGKRVQDIHFHEVGAIDSIVDIVGAVIGFEKLGVEKIYASEIPVGRGFVTCQHGKIPVPVPATLALLKNIPIRPQNIPTELTTPTAASFLKVFVKDFGLMPSMQIASLGYGAGTKELEIPNVLRIIIGDDFSAKKFDDQVFLLETNVDDMNPEIVGYVAERLREKGALDVYVIPVYMKKNRPGILLGVVTPSDHLDDFMELIFQETSTIGIRVSGVGRAKLKRVQSVIDTPIGAVDVKVSSYKDKIMNISPEFESCRQIAIKKNIPLKEVYRLVELAKKKKIIDKGNL